MTLVLCYSNFKKPIKRCFHEVATCAVTLVWHLPHCQAVSSSSSWRHWDRGVQPDPGPSGANAEATAGCSGQCLGASGQCLRMGIPQHLGPCPRDVLPGDSSSINKAIFRLQKQPPFLTLLLQPSSWTMQSLNPLLTIVIILLLLGLKSAFLGHHMSSNCFTDTENI